MPFAPAPSNLSGRPRSQIRHSTTGIRLPGCRSTTVISPEAIYQWDAGAGTSNYAFLKDDQGGDIASYVSSINFGAQQNNYVGYAEIEVLGADDTTTRLLNITGNPSTGGEASPAYGLYFPDDMDGRTLSATPVYTCTASL